MRIPLAELDRRLEAAREMIDPCRLCPRRCLARRLHGETGFCGVPGGAVVSSHGAHFGEEPELVGYGGSGTIFLAGCNLLCSFCQNFETSHLRQGRAWAAHDLAAAMLALERGGCHNINLVTPTHFVPPILEALRLAAGAGLRLPLVYNCGGYESLDTLRLLEGVVDIYMPDIKFASAAASRDFCNAPEYPEVARAALKEMHRQVGILRVDPLGLAVRGLLIRHLVMPGGHAGSEEVLGFIARELSPDSYLNLMDQYHPCHRAVTDPRIGRRTTRAEYSQALTAARRAGLHRGF